MNDNIIKTTSKKFAAKVRQMRDAQKQYFRAPYGSDEKSRALTTSKQLEGEVDKLLQSFETTIDKL